MGRSQRHKTVEQGVSSSGELISEGGYNPAVADALLEIAEEIEGAKPILNELSQTTAAISDPDFTISCIGTNFDENCKIIWNGGEEPTTLVGPTELTTLVKPSVVTSPTVVTVFIRTEISGLQLDSNQLEFTWTEAEPPPETLAGSRGRE